jgi:hypothetical protein
MGALAVAITGTSVIGVPDGVYWHEIWATLLIALSLLSYRKAPLWLTVGLGILACLVRELALPFILVMMVFAAAQRRWMELCAWLAAVCLFAAAFMAHLFEASRLYRPGDLISESWLGLNGWNFSVATAKWNVILHVMPSPLIALAICLGILGLAGARDERAQRAALVVFGYVFAFTVVGRPDNYYWGILYAPLLSTGFLFVPASLRDIWARLVSGARGSRVDLKRVA